MSAVNIGLVGDYRPEVPAHQAIPVALKMAGEHAGCDVQFTWVHTASLQSDVSEQLSQYNGIWCVPASPYANMEGALAAIRYAREMGKPFLGTCGGFQHALLEYARNVLALSGAEHGESSPDAEVLLITPLTCSLVEQSGEIIFQEGSRVREAYGLAQAEEPYRCRFGLNTQYENLFEGSDLRIVGRDLEGDVRAVELNGHPFFIATLFQPERAALKGMAHPLVNAFVKAATGRP